MTLDIQYKILEDPRQRTFLRENSYWYKYLNRSNIYYKQFLEDMKDKYKLKPTDKLNKIMDNIEMVKTFLDVLK
ncbi:MAG: YlbE-like family protein [Mycoplasmatota bacterium]|nr:YlbE-like family protein [Mycoplasmatota bacterium]